MDGDRFCATGILSLTRPRNCLNVTTNHILCGVEIAIGAFVLVCLLREIKRVTSLLQAMLVCNTVMLTSVLLVCMVSLADSDPTMEVSYALLCVGHVGWVFGVACRLLVLATVVFRASPRRRNASTKNLARLLFGIAAGVSVVNAVLWLPASAYAPPGSPNNELVHRFGFFFIGLAVFGYSLGLGLVSRSVMKLYDELRMDDPAEVAKRQKGLGIIRKMTFSTVAALFSSSIIYIILGSVPGALRNEAVHVIFFLGEFSMLNLLPFVRATAQIREQNAADSKETPRKETGGGVMRTFRTPSSRSSSNMGASKNSGKEKDSQSEPPSTYSVEPEARDAREPNSVVPASTPTSASSAASPEPSCVAQSKAKGGPLEQLQEREEAQERLEQQQQQQQQQLEVIIEAPSAELVVS